MGQIDLGDPLTFLSILFQAVRGVLLLRPEVFMRTFAYQGSLYGLPLWVAFIAGLSLSLGQSVVLFANRVSRTRFWISIVLGALSFVLSVLLVTLVIWGLVNWLGAREWPYLQTARAVTLAYAPYWLGFLILIPTLGIHIQRLLRVYVFLALVVAAVAIFEITFVPAAIGAAVAMLLGRLLEVALSRLFSPLIERFVSRVTGVQEWTSTREIYELFAVRSRIDPGKEA